MDLSSAKATAILKLNKKDAIKKLQVAVRETQGGKRANWAPAERPWWWKENYQVVLPNGDTVKSLPFVSQSKLYWAAGSVKVTLLIYEFRDELNENNPDFEGEPAKGPIEISSPQLQPQGEDNLPFVPVEPQVPQINLDDENEQAIANGVGKEQTEVPDEGQSQKQNQPLKKKDTRKRKQRKGANEPRQDSPPKESIGDADDRTPQSSQESTQESQEEIHRRQRQERIEKEVDQLVARTKKVLRKWQDDRAEARKKIAGSIQSKITALTTEFAVAKMRAPRNVMPMSLVEYSKSFGAEAEKLLKQEITDAVESMVEKVDSTLLLMEDEGTADVQPQTDTEKRRNELTATARKTARAGRRRQMDAQATPGVRMTRSRTQRESAMKAVDRNRQILQTSVIRKQKSMDRSAITDVSTPVARMRTRRADNPRLRKYMETARQQKGNRKEFCEEQARQLEKEAAKEMEDAEREAKEAELQRERARVKRKQAKEKMEQAQDWVTAGNDPTI